MRHSRLFEDAGIWHVDAKREIYDTPSVPGVRMAIRLARAVFGIEAAPLDSGGFPEFNEQDE